MKVFFDKIASATRNARVQRESRLTREVVAEAEDTSGLVAGEDGLLRVRADEAELQHTLVNLLINAIQACPSGGRVAVETTADTMIHIRVKDDGCGIAPDDVKRIFEPFFSMRKGGTGLGLFLSLNFVRHWGGDIHVESVPDQGSTFDVVLPAFVAGAALEAAP